ncbi:MAG: hypothetical protein WKG07_10140 [Hymenobacter sp.]
MSKLVALTDLGLIVKQGLGGSAVVFLNSHAHGAAAWAGPRCACSAPITSSWARPPATARAWRGSIACWVRRCGWAW